MDNHKEMLVDNCLVERVGVRETVIKSLTKKCLVFIGFSLTACVVPMPIESIGDQVNLPRITHIRLHRACTRPDHRI